MSEWKIEKSRATCGACAKKMSERDEYYSAIADNAGKFQRTDYCLSCWGNGRGDALFSYWKTVVPVREERKREDIQAVTEFFRKLLSRSPLEPEKERVLYLVSLILMRRRRLKLLRTERSDRGDVMVLEQMWDGESARIHDPGIGEEEIERIKTDMEQLFAMEFGPAPAGEPPDTSGGQSQ